MPRTIEPDPAVQQIKELVDPALDRLGADVRRLGKALRRAHGASQTAAPPDAVRATVAARRHVLALMAQLDALVTDHPAKQSLIEGLTFYADALAASRRSLATADPKQGTSFHRLARDRFTRAGKALLAADRAMGCVYGCQETKLPKPRRRTR